MDIIFIIGRILLGGFFLMMGVNHFKEKTSMVGYAKSKGIKSAEAAVTISGVFMVLGGLGIILGTFIQIAMGLLVLFLVPTSFIMHKFWKETDPQVRMSEQTNFMKNMAILGALLILIALGGPWPISIF